MQKPTIVIIENPPWADTAQAQLADDYHLVRQQETNGYMNTLIENLAAMVLVDDSSDWVTWASVPKSSPATRRIPIVLVSDDEKTRQRADTNGADIAVSTEEFEEQILTLIQTHARLPDTERQEQLECDCQEPLPELARQGVEKFNAGEYYAQHDLFEEQWVETERPVRDLYRAVLQVGVAYYQIERGNYRGALKMLQRSVQWLIVLPDTCQGINVKKLRDDSFHVRNELERLGEENFEQFDMSLLTGVEWEPQSDDDADSSET